MRDVSRYLNTLRFNFGLLGKEVNPVDLITISAIQVFAPKAYYLMSNHKNALTGIMDSGASIKDEIQTICDSIIKAADCIEEQRFKELLIRIFPKLEAVYNNMHYGSDWSASWRKEGRICSPDIFNLFFQFVVPTDDISNSEMERILLSSSNLESFNSHIENLIETDRINRFLEKFEDYTKDFDENNIENVIKVLFDIGDSLPEDNTGFYSFSPYLRIIRVISQLLSRLPDKSRRYEIIRNAIDYCNKSLYSFIHVLSWQDREHGRFKCERTGKEGEELLEEDKLGLLEEIACQRIAEWNSNGQLQAHKDLVSILYDWKRWAGEQVVNDYISSITKDDEGLIHFIEKFVRETRSQTMGDYALRKQSRINLDNVKDFIDVDEAASRLRSIVSSPKNPLEEEAESVTKVFLDEYVGTIDD